MPSRRLPNRMIILRVADVVYLTRGDAVLILNNFNSASIASSMW